VIARRSCFNLQRPGKGEKEKKNRRGRGERPSVSAIASEKRGEKRGRVKGKRNRYALRT